MVLPPSEEAPMKAVHCPCGEVVEAETDDELVAGVEQHVQDKHPEMVGQYSREQILSMAHEH
jgi:hypothetical protein